VYIGPNTPRGTNKNPNRVPDLLTKVLPKAASGLASKPWQEGLGTRQPKKKSERVSTGAVQTGVQQTPKDDEEELNPNVRSPHEQFSFVTHRK
jgi:hypothetical protein